MYFYYTKIGDNIHLLTLINIKIYTTEYYVTNCLS